MIIRCLFAQFRREVDGHCADTRSNDSALRTGPMMFCAIGVGTMPWAVRTNSGSLKVSRRRAPCVATAIGWSLGAMAESIRRGCLCTR